MEGQMSKKNDDEKLDKYLDMFSLNRQPRGEREAGHGDNFKYKKIYCKGQSCFKPVKPSAKKILDGV